MDRQPVSSSNIASIGYDEGSGTLEVEFLNGAVYRYFDVPSNLYEALMAAASHGTFLNANIKGAYQYEKQ
jgi:hypothetical protein